MNHFRTSALHSLFATSPLPNLVLLGVLNAFQLACLLKFIVSLSITDTTKQIKPHQDVPILWLSSEAVPCGGQIIEAWACRL